MLAGNNTTGASADIAIAGRAVVVTGVGRAGQAGESVARAFAASGAIVHCVDREAGVHERVAELVGLGFAAIGHVADLTDFEAVTRLAKTIEANHPGNVAGVAAIAGGFGESGPIAESDPQVFARQIAINLTSAYATARAFAPSVRASRGAFVFVTAAAVLSGKVARLSAYAMAKGGLVQLVRALAQEEREFGVRVNAVAPTALRTTTNLESMGTSLRYVEREELAATIVALCGPAFARVTGQIIEIA